MKKILKNAFGFGLVEVLMAAGLAGGIALTIAKLSQDANRVTKTTETNNEINMFMTDAAYILSDKENCMKTIVPGTPVSGAPITAIKKFAPAPPPNDSVSIYSVGQKYGNGLFSITGMQTDNSDGNPNLKITIVRNNVTTTGARSIVKKIPLKVVLAGGNIASCFSDTEDMIEDAAKAACTGNSAKWDDLNKVCVHDILITGANASGVCPDGQALKAMVAGTAPNNGEPANFTCQPIFSTTCPGGQFIKGLNPDGSVNCADLTSCAPGQYLKQNATGGLDCVDIPSCGADQVLHTKPDGSFGCSDSACGDNQYLQAINSNGAKLCKTIPNGACGSGMYVKEVKTNGDLVCEPVPSGASLPTVAYSFADGFDSSNNTWSRKTIDQTAQQICTRITGFTWNGTNCIPTAAGTTDFEAICLKFPGHTWNGSQCVSASEFSKLINFQLRFNGTSWSVSLTRVIYSTSAADKNINVVIDTVTGSGGAFRFRIHHNTYYMNSTELISAVLSTRDGNNYNLRVGDVSGNNELEFAKADDASYNNFANGDVINVIWGY